MPETYVYSRSQIAHVYRPPGQLDYRSAVLQLHGGGWRAGHPSDLAARSLALAALGFTCVPIEYSLVGIRPWPAALDDIAAAVAWVQENWARLGVEPGRIALQGYSAGGHLALMYALAAVAGTTPSGQEAPGVAAVLASYPPVLLQASVQRFRVADLSAPVDLRRLIDLGSGALPAWMLLGGDDGPAAAADASPLTLVRAGLPPISLVHGTADPVVPVTGTTRMWGELQRLGIDAELHLHAGQIHEFDAAPPYLELVQAQAAVFLRRHLAEDAELTRNQLDCNPLAALQGLSAL